MLTIHQTRDEVTFRNSDGAEETIGLDQSRIRSMARVFIEQVNARTGPLGMDAKAALDAVKHLSDAAYSTLARSAVETHSSVDERWGRVMAWLRAAPGTRAGKPPSTLVEIEVVGSTDYLPWEWMGPIIDVGPAQSTASECHTRLVATASDLLGMAMCRRIYVGDTQTASLRAIRSQMQVRGFFNPTLLTAPEEIEYFRDDRFRLIGPLPDPLAGLGGELADHLFDPAFPAPDGMRVGTDEVVHFCCHHQAEGSTARDFDDIPSSTLVFNASTTVATDVLEQELITRSRGSSSTSNRPLVFLNLCGGEVQPGTLASLTRLFVYNSNPCVIGTTAIVTDRVASAFMREFYDHYRQSDTAAESLWHAKYALLTRHKNPFGLLYTLCGDPSMRVIDTATP